MKGICSIEGCNRVHKAKGYCSTHYKRLLRTGKVGSKTIAENPQKKRICNVKGCYEVHVARGYCAKHYQRFFVLDGFEEGKRVCSVKGCRNKYHGKGYCQSHYKKFLKYGNALERKEGSSFGERRIKEVVNKMGFICKTQKTFKGCTNVKLLRFDIYVPRLKTCIEYHGKQHYEPVEMFGGEEGFADLQKRDQIKREFCRDNDIRLIEIAYYDKDKIEDILNSLLV